MAAATNKVSFTIRRPTPISRADSSGGDDDTGPSFKVPSLPRHLANPNDSTPGSPLARSTTSSPKLPPQPRDKYYNGDYRASDSSDEEDDRLQDELVTGFDKFGVQRCVYVSTTFSQSFQLTKVPSDDYHHPLRLHKDKKPKQGPLVIPPQANRDWRAVARKRRGQGQYVPASAKAETGADGSVGGLGTRDSINSGPVLSGLQIKKREVHIKREDGVLEQEVVEEDVKMEVVEETEDQKALRAILAGTDGADDDGPMIDIIPTPMSETDALRQDVEDLPDVSTLEDYARVPVSQFGAALLRGMGWKEGTAASRKPGKGIIEPYLPEARPALLGIGAKEREVLDDGSKKRKGQNNRPERRYVPVMRREREDTPGSGSGSGRDRRDRSRSPGRTNGSTTVSRRGSRSPDRRGDDGGRDRRRNSDRRDTDRRDRERPSERRDRDQDTERRDRNRDYDREKDRRRVDSERERGSDRSRDYDSRERDSSRRRRDH